MAEELTLYTGFKLGLDVIFKDENGIAINLTGFGATLVISANQDITSNKYVELNTSGPNITIPTPANGTVKCVVPGSESIKVPPGLHRLTIYLTDTALEKDPLVFESIRSVKIL